MENIDTFLTSRAAGNKYEEEYDNTLSVKLYTTIYYTRKVESGKDYIKLTRVTGGITDIDSFISVTKQVVTLGCFSRAVGNQRQTFYPTSSSFSSSVRSIRRIE